MKNPETPALPDGDAERARKQHVICIRELQEAPFVKAQVVENQKLADGVSTTIAHKLGRVPKWVCPSAPRGATTAGVIIDMSRESGIDRTKYVALKATGYGATITIDVAVA